MSSAFLGLLDPGDEVVVFEPFYESYGPDAILSGARLRYVTLRPPDWTFDPAELEAVFGPATRAVVVGSPHNPTGKVFSPTELGQIAELCVRHDAIAITDEIYEHIRYEGEHIPIATLPGMRDRTVTISGASKTFSVTGWRVGWIVAPPALTAGIRKVHDFLTVGAPAPLQEAIAAGLALGRPYYDTLSKEYRARRDILVPALERAGFAPRMPEGAYYVLCDITPFGFDDDTSFAHWLVSKVGVAGVPGSSFYSRPELGRHLIRFTFCKTDELLRDAAERLARTQELADRR
jgi:aminotransferase